MIDVSYSDLVRAFGRIGMLSFGGPAAQIALMHRELVEDRAWLTERQYLGALSFCMLLPGPEAMQLATYAGWRLRGIPGGLIAGGLFVLPGAVVIMALALGYLSFGATPLAQAMFLGIKAAVIIIVLQALRKVAAKALTGARGWAVAGLAFGALFAFAVPYPLIILAAALWGSWALGQTTTALAMPLNQPWTTTLTVFGFGLLVWVLPFGLATLFGATLLTEIGLFFSKLAVVTFGGAYAVLAYMTQEVVQDYGWLTTAQMMDGLGLAETTPGPLILVTQFVAAITAGLEMGYTGAVAGAAMALWVTFVPCFIWIFAGAPYIEWITNQPRLKGALDGITAAVVGVIANLSVWFAAHVFFAEIESVSAGPIHIIAPVWVSLDLHACVLCGLAATLMLWRGWPLPRTLVGMATAGWGVTLGA